jgi:hypothetical protein
MSGRSTAQADRRRVDAQEGDERSQQGDDRHDDQRRQ